MTVMTVIGRSDGARTRAGVRIEVARLALPRVILLTTSHARQALRIEARMLAPNLSSEDKSGKRLHTTSRYQGTTGHVY